MILGSPAWSQDRDRLAGSADEGSAVANRQVAGDVPEEEHRVPGISGEQPGRVGVDPVGPFEADLLEEAGGPADPTRDEVERRADLDAGRDPQLVEVLVQPEFSLGLAEGDHQEVGPGRPDGGDQPVGTLPRQRSGGRAGGPDDPEARSIRDERERCAEIAEKEG